MTPLRIAILAHSTNPRGGVVHALELGDALTRLGHEATVHAPDPMAAGFFRPTLCRAVSVPVAPTGMDVEARGPARSQAEWRPVGRPESAPDLKLRAHSDAKPVSTLAECTLAGMVEARVADYLDHFGQARHRHFDVWHAQDGISGNALATLKERGLIPGFVRTVHHVDTFADPRLVALQARSIGNADRLFVVSRLWRDFLAHAFGREAIVVGNGVDTEKFSPVPDATEPALRARLGLPAGSRPVCLAVGGVEERKNTIRILEAFRAIPSEFPSARLVIAGGASLLDHGEYQARFATALAQSGLPDGAVIRTGPLPQELMPALYRAADALVFPSTREGFGLVVLEAMASGVPVVTSRLAPFTEYLGDADVLWCDPLDTASIAAAMAASLDSSRRRELIAGGLQTAARHDWATSARAHLAAYRTLKEPAHA